MKSLLFSELDSARKKILFYFLVVGFYLLIIFIFYPGLFLHFSSRVPYGHHGDVKNILSIISFSVRIPLSQIYHLPVFYPESYVLAQTHPLFGVSLFFKLFHIIGLNLQQSNNLYIILSLILGSFGCYLLAKEFSKYKFLALLFSFMYIIHHWNFLYFTWLNFLSRFYLPFVFFFFIRFFKTKKRIYIFWASMAAFLQFLSSVYYGVHLWVFILPSFLLFALILKLLSFKDFKFIFIFLGLGIVLILFIFHPFFNITQSAVEKDFDWELVNSADLFSYSKIFRFWFDYPKQPALNLFPGFAFFLFVLFFFISLLKKKEIKNIFFLILFALTIAMTYLAYVNVMLLEFLFFIFLGFIITAVISGWSRLTQWEKLVLSVFIFYFLLLFHFPQISFLNRISLYHLFTNIFPLAGLVNIRRIFLFILPILIVFATIGGTKLLEALGKTSWKKFFIIFFLIFSFMILENIPFPMPIVSNSLMRKISKLNPEVYQKLPFNDNKVILEIPFYFGMETRNSIYSLNWQYHQNVLINGKTSIKPQKYFNYLKKIIGRFQKKFPNKSALKELIQKYSLNYIIFHWDLLEVYHHDQRVREKIMPKIKSINQYGRIVFDNEKVTLLKTQEYIPVKSLKRTYSKYHLKNQVLRFRLKSGYLGEILVFLNNNLLKKQTLRGVSFKYSFKDQTLKREGNMIEFRFDSPVLIEEIFFKRKKQF